jgi:DNA-binding MarR family transcriptional regulator
VRASDADLMELVELFFFAYRGFTSGPDAILAEYGFGRAHHRVLHFVHRRPGLNVAELLDILKITKQSLARVLKQLVDEGFIAQTMGPDDRRERRLHPTAKGSALALRLAGLQMARLAEALAALPPGQAAAVRTFFHGMINEDGAGEADRLSAHPVDPAKEPDTP